MERLGDDARRLLAATGAPRSDLLAAVVAAWPTAVGDAISRAAWPQRLARDGTLHVATSSSAWAFELARLAGEITTRLRGQLGDDAPSSLRFAPGPVPSPSADPADLDPPAPPAASPETVAEASRLAAPIEDDALRALVARAAAASLARARSDRGFC
jgi:hypothetical protein